MIKLLDIPLFKECLFYERINRFVVEVENKGKIERVHINNTGRLKNIFYKGNKGYCIPIKGKVLRYRLFAMGNEPNELTLIDTSLHMKSFEKIIEKGIFEEFNNFSFKRNPRYLNSTFDYLLSRENREIIVEIKSAVMKEGEYASYPDAPTKRGVRHIKELIELKKEGKEAMILFVASLPNIKGFTPNKKISPEILSLLKKAKNIGIMLKSINILFSSENSMIYLDNPHLFIKFK